MPGNDSTNSAAKGTSSKKVKATTSSQIVTAESVQAEEVPTLPIGPLQTLSTLQPEVSVHSVTPTQAVSKPVPLVAQAAEYRRGLHDWIQVWWEGIRPVYLPLSILPVVLGSVLAWTQTVTAKAPWGSFHLFHFIATLAAVILIQVGAHLVNDYYDYLKGIDTSNALGPGGLIQQGLVQPTRVLYTGLTSLMLGALVGIIVTFAGGPLVFLFGLLGVLCAYFYSATSRSLSSLMLGETISFFIFGPLITLGAYAVQMGHVDRFVFLYSLPLGFLATAAIHVNNMRDMESDMQAGKLTLASALGLGLSRVLYILLLLGAYIPILALALPHHTPHLLLITLWTLPTLVVLISGIVRTDTPAGLQLVMRQTIKLALYFTLLFVAALIVAALWPMLPHIPSKIPF
jgi:1,4-dihydroxy-2-naphthoate polyprenyltransferase